jgi:hypothetical protein
MRNQLRNLRNLRNDAIDCAACLDNDLCAAKVPLLRGIGSRQIGGSDADG